MLDFFAIFSKGGLVLWCCQSTNESYILPINDLIQNVIIPEKTFGDLSRQYKQLMMKYKLDNEFELVYVLAYQHSIKLSYVDKLLSDVQLYFRDKFKNELAARNFGSTFDFMDDYKALLKEAESEAKKNESKRVMRSFEDSEKSKKTVATGLIIKPKNENDSAKSSSKLKNEPMPPPTLPISPAKSVGESSPSPISASSDMSGGSDPESPIDSITAARSKMAAKLAGTKRPDKKESAGPQKKGKVSRTWGYDEKNTKGSKDLDYSSPAPASGSNEAAVAVTDADRKLVGTMKGGLQDISEALAFEDNDAEEYDFGEEEELRKETTKLKKPVAPGTKKGVWGLFDSLVGAVAGAPLTQQQMAPALERLRDHLISKNVAAEVAEKLVNSVGARLEGKVLGSFQTVNAAVKAALQESCMQLLQPSRRIDLLAGALDAKRRNQEGSTSRPYIVTFCGVNGVGKSTNLAKICFWLMENRLRVLIAACDTFRSGAIEQLRTHVRRLSALHPPVDNKNCVEVFEKGYGKDAAGVAMEAINYARQQGFDVVLVDTAGRMQDNRPLMVALSKLIHVNQPDLVLFVGEALVGNDGVDQLVKFQQALLDNAMGPTANMNATGQAPIDAAAPRSIDGVVLTKFDTIDDKVGAAISMTYTTGKPIVFVGTGQTYADLATLNADSVVRALMK